jgi:hypothetical protein
MYTILSSRMWYKGKVDIWASKDVETRFLGQVHMGSQVPITLASLNMEAKS